MKFPEGCKAEKETVLEEKKRVSGNFDSKLILYAPYIHENGERTDTNGYIPKSWEGGPCNADLVTEGFIEKRDNNGTGYFLSIASVKNNNSANNKTGLQLDHSIAFPDHPTFSFAVPRALPELQFKKGDGCRLDRTPYPGRANEDLINAYGICQKPINDQARDETPVPKTDSAVSYRSIVLSALFKDTLPEDIWMPDSSLHWEGLPNTCKESQSSKDGKEPPGLDCEDISYAKDQWPKLRIDNSEGRPVLTATLALSDLSEPRLFDKRYVFYFKGLPAGLRPDTNPKQACEFDVKTQFWHCTTDKIMRRLVIKDGRNQTSTISIPSKTLKPGGTPDWTEWLTDLPLIWKEKGDFFVRFPTPQWQELRLYDQSNCQARDESHIHPLQDLQSRGIKSIQARLGSSLRLVGKRSDRRTECVSLSKDMLRIEDENLKLAFSLRLENRERRPNERILQILDVSDRMAQYSGKLSKILHAYDPPPDRPLTLGLMGNRLYVQAHAETFDVAAFRADVGRLQFNHHPDDLMTFLALALESFRGTRSHTLRVFLSPRWAKLPDGFQYPLRGTGYLNQILKVLEVRTPVKLYLLAGKERNCDSLETSLPKDLKDIFECHPLPMDKLSDILKTP